MGFKFCPQVERLDSRDLPSATATLDQPISVTGADPDRGQAVVTVAPLDDGTGGGVLTVQWAGGATETEQLTADQVGAVLNAIEVGGGTGGGSENVSAPGGPPPRPPVNPLPGGGGTTGDMMREYDSLVRGLRDRAKAIQEQIEAVRALQNQQAGILLQRNAEMAKPNPDPARVAELQAAIDALGRRIEDLNKHILSDVADYNAEWERATGLWWWLWFTGGDGWRSQREAGPLGLPERLPQDALDHLQQLQDQLI